MKIAVLVYRLNGIDGIAKHSLYLSREFAAMGHQVTVWSVEYNEDHCYPELTEGLVIERWRLGAPPRIDETRKPPRMRMQAHMWALWRYYCDQRALVSAMPSGYDVINAHGNTISWAAAAHKRRYGTPVVWMCNDFWPVASQRYEIVSNTWQKIKHVAKETLVSPFTRYDQAAVREIDKIAVLSEQVATQMIEHYGVDPVVVRKGVDSSRFAQGDGQKIRSRYHIRDSTFLLLTVGMLMPRRRFEDIVRAVRILIDEGLDVTYIVAGRMSHSPAYSQFVQAEVAACNLGDHVKFIGEVSEEDLVDHYHACDAFAWVSDERQSWGSAAMEAMAAAKPIIVSRANGLAEVLENNETALLVPARSPEAIAKAVKRLMGDSVLANTVAKQGQRLMRERYSWRIYAETMLARFREAIDKQ